ncbi:hypothetical protein MLD59_02595 [Verrucomicrobiaceae bacterium E54]|nr:hypothetical protein [Verrucomicrobiaceae bacterium E54]
MSHDMAVRIRHQLGCEIVFRKDKGSQKKVWDVSDKKTREDGTRSDYVQKDYTNHRAMLSAIMEERDGLWEEGLASAVTLVAQAARKAKRLPAVAHALEQSLASTIESFALENHVVGLFRADYELSDGEAKAAEKRLLAAPTSTGLEFSRRKSAPHSG